MPELRSVDKTDESTKQQHIDTVATTATSIILLISESQRSERGLLRAAA